MGKIKCLIVDDETLARKLVASHIAKVEDMELLGECANAVEAANFLHQKSVDLIFPDIQMPGMTGLQLAQSLTQRPSIILTTAYREFAPEAFDLEVVDYLLKPVSFERFLKAVNRYIEKLPPRKIDAAVSAPDGFIYLKADRKTHKIALHNIIYLESLDDYVKVHEEGKITITRENISSLEEKLPGPPFVRIHRSFIVNAAWVKIISNESVLVNGKELPLGRVFKKSALSQLSFIS
jgi:DNA-binding LytR/AlgR family response regulator